jgi:hypothetical protein
VSRIFTAAFRIAGTKLCRCLGLYDTLRREVHAAARLHSHRWNDFPDVPPRAAGRALVRRYVLVRIRLFRQKPPLWLEFGNFRPAVPEDECALQVAMRHHRSFVAAVREVSSRGGSAKTQPLRNERQVPPQPRLGRGYPSEGIGAASAGKGGSGVRTGGSRPPFCLGGSDRFLTDYGKGKFNASRSRIRAHVCGAESGPRIAARS